MFDSCNRFEFINRLIQSINFNQILQAKESLAEVTKDLQERLYRWKQIEQICNFSIQTNKGEGFLQSELYKQLISGGGGGGKLNPHQWLNSSLHSNSMPRTGSEGTLIESEDGFSAHSNPIGFSTGNFNSFNSSLPDKSDDGECREIASKLLRQRTTTTLPYST